MFFNGFSQSQRPCLVQILHRSQSWFLLNQRQECARQPVSLQYLGMVILAVVDVICMHSRKLHIQGQLAAPEDAFTAACLKGVCTP